MTRRTGTARTGVALTAAVVAALLTACDDGGRTSPPLPPPSPSPSSGSPDAGGEAPSVPNPLDSASLTGDPCAALTEEQRSELGLAAGSVRESAETAGDACRWERTEDSLDLADLALVTENANGLSDIYGFEDRNDYFEPTEVAGYPAVYTGLIDNRDSGMCDLWVGVNDSEVLYILTNLASADTAEASCGLAADVADAAISTLGG
ncbi:DUF3558 domain-containing protein [Saccharomonospora piscinae]|uniref:DUF3558 domain-containing protein n=1 Tax=Saccharomonospora piscinae TaxID=687388 RepID=UPI0011075C62|nr:DUF3558 domain-containing protein [Saccharomonospora piscinae]TLW93334.1 DUF3558 domain-containing protein [Saccharomonospora piscinae]